MTDIIERVHRDQPTIDRLKQLQQELDSELIVELHMADGRVLKGTVVERPALIQFVDREGNEGLNGLLRFDAGTGTGDVDLLLIDEIARVVRVGSA